MILSINQGEPSKHCTKTWHQQQRKDDPISVADRQSPPHPNQHNDTHTHTQLHLSSPSQLPTPPCRSQSQRQSLPYRARSARRGFCRTPRDTPLRCHAAQRWLLTQPAHEGCRSSTRGTSTELHSFTELHSCVCPRRSTEQKRKTPCR